MSCACRGRLRFRFVRLVQALPSSPSSAGLVPCPPAFAFLFSLPFRGFCPFRARCVVLVFALSLFSCVPLFASWLGNFHSIFTFMSFSPSSHLPRCCGACVCVYHLNRCKTSIICRGPPGSRGGRWPTKTPPRDPC